MIDTPLVRSVDASSAVLVKDNTVAMVNMGVGDGGMQIYSRIGVVLYHERYVEVEDGKDVTTRCLLQLWYLAKIVRNWEQFHVSWYSVVLDVRG